MKADLLLRVLENYHNHVLKVLHVISNLKFDRRRLNTNRPGKNSPLPLCYLIPLQHDFLKPPLPWKYH